jgi:hypothetical protein
MNMHITYQNGSIVTFTYTHVHAHRFYTYIYVYRCTPNPYTHNPHSLILEIGPVGSINGQLNGSAALSQYQQSMRNSGGDITIGRKYIYIYIYICMYIYIYVCIYHEDSGGDITIGRNT